MHLLIAYILTEKVKHIIEIFYDSKMIHSVLLWSIIFLKYTYGAPG